MRNQPPIILVNNWPQVPLYITSEAPPAAVKGHVTCEAVTCPHNGCCEGIVALMSSQLLKFESSISPGLTRVSGVRV